ncbi:MAG TPA: hypothetical protein PLQ20_02595 [Candidatus Paceibacterota bacterium]|nr:hypothetical protein [Candidatus Paceibacterota bacterium]
MKKLILLLVFVSCFLKLKSQSWNPLPGGSLDGEPLTMISFGGYRWISGLFYHAGAIPAQFTVRHDGTSWISTPATPNPIRNFCVWNDTLYGAGSFSVGSNTYGAVKWNGSSWEYFGIVPDGFGFKTLYVFNNKLTFGGRCFSVDGIPINHLASWDGSVWSSFPFTITCFWLVLPDIKVVKEFNGYLYVGGGLSDINGLSSNLIFKTDGTSVVQMGLESNYHVADIIKYRDSIFAVGNFPFGPFPPNQGSPGIVKTNDVVWEQVEHGLKMRPNTGTKYLTDLYVGGIFNPTCYNTPCNHADVGNLGKWDGSSWSNESAGLFNQGSEIISFLYTDTLTGTIYALGDFHTARGDVADFIAKKSISVVPVKLSFFSARLNINKQTILSWRDETPADNVRFEIQMSKDGRNFQKVGEMFERSDQKDYLFSYNPEDFCGQMFFRLKFEGKYSDTRSVSIPCDVNIFSDGKYASIQNKNPGTITLINSLGQKIIQKSINAGYTQIPLTSLPKGSCIATFVDFKGNIFSKKIAIQ